MDSKAFLNLDVCTRWNSTYEMLKAACTYEKVFARYPDEDPYYTIELLSDIKLGVPGLGVPEEHDWDNARKLAEFLGHFAGITKRVSASLSVTAHRYFHEIGEVNEVVTEWMSSSDLVRQEMGRRMKDKYDKYWGNWHQNLEVQTDKGKGKGKDKEKENIKLLIFVAAVLDPRYKLSQYIEMIIKEMYGVSVRQKVWAAITKCLQDLFEEYKKNSSPSDVQSQPSESSISKESGEDGGKLKAKLAKKIRLNSGTSSCSRGSRTELDRYLAEECEEDSKKFDILAWWKGQSNRFPILSTLARDVLAIPISTVASESAFSTGGRILDDFRSSITPFMIEALVCTQNWLRRGTPINLTEDTEELTKLQEGDHLLYQFFIVFNNEKNT